jgi:formylglycine-generating enzyme required for sulfatase activity
VAEQDRVRLAEAFTLERYRVPPRDAVPVPGSVFRMGTDGVAVPALRSRYGVSFRGSFENEVPSHAVEVSPFLMDRYEVTNARFAAFVEARPEWRPGSVPPERQNGHYLERWTDGHDPSSRADHPVVFVTWHAAQAFCRWAAAACRPRRVEPRRERRDAEFPWGDELPCRARQHAESGRGDTVPVGRYPRTRSAHDLAGNDRELALDGGRNPEGSQRDRRRANRRRPSWPSRVAGSSGAGASGARPST